MPEHGSHWQRIAQSWRHVGPPLRPSPGDCHLVQEAVDDWAGRNGPPRVLLLGVTQEFRALAWPPGTALLAADRNPAMIQALWESPHGGVTCADWRALPLGDASRDIVLCDGGLHLLDYPEGQRQFAAELRRVVAAGGLAILRLFALPAEPETKEAVLEELYAGRIPDLNHLKLRLAMAMTPNSQEGVALRDIWRAVPGLEDGYARLAGWLGQPAEHAAVLASYRESREHYHFLSTRDAVRLFCSGTGGFLSRQIRIPGYPLGDRCPTMILERTETPDAQFANE